MKILLVLTMFIELNFQELKLYDKRKGPIVNYVTGGGGVGGFDRGYAFQH